MKTINMKSIKKYFTLENAVDIVSLTNTVALSTAEKVIMKQFSLVDKFQHITNNTIKKGLGFSAKQQDIVFDVLESSKEKMIKRFKK
jgi:hypothetical protein